ncbi:unannotated protein [freshwater metagenome]|uniref:Unannotated protein n=1 Tax=freshwater metagenome TaxID=449393 RepID=A0A6J6JA06_9ZZZZ
MPTKSTPKSSAKPGSGAGMSAAEKQAIRERAQELKAQEKGIKGLAEVEAKWKLMKPANRALAQDIHKIIMAVDSEIETKTWYSMPAYYKDGKLICFFQSADKWGTRYSTLGFDANAKLDDGSMWATAFALTKLVPANTKSIKELVAKAIGKK